MVSHRIYVLVLILLITLAACTSDLNNIPPEPPEPGTQHSNLVGSATGTGESYYANPLSSFTIEPATIIFDVDDQEKSIFVELKDDLVYQYGYYIPYGSDEWIRFELSAAESSKNWLLGSGSASISLDRSVYGDVLEEKAIQAVILFSCTSQGIGWDCHGDKWQLKTFEVDVISCDCTDLSLDLCLDIGEAQDNYYCSSEGITALPEDPELAEENEDEEEEESDPEYVLLYENLVGGIGDTLAPNTQYDLSNGMMLDIKESFILQSSSLDNPNSHLFGKDVYLTVYPGAKLYATFDDTIQLFGETFDVLANGEDYVELAKSFRLERYDSISYDATEIEVVAISDSAVLFDIDGNTESVPLNAKELIGNDISITVTSIVENFDQTDDINTYADIMVGKEVFAGDSATLFAQPLDEDEAEWVWFVEGNELGVVYAQDRDNHPSEVDDADEFAALAAGDKLFFPKEYGYVEYVGLEDVSYNILDVEIQTAYDIADLENVWGYEITYDDDELFIAYVDNVPQIYDVDSQELLSTESYVINNVLITVEDNDQSLELTLPSDEQLTLTAFLGNDYFGSTDQEDADDLEISIRGEPGTAIGNYDFEGGYLVTEYGAYLENPEDQFGSGNTFSMMVPEDVVLGSMNIYVLE